MKINILFQSITGENETTLSLNNADVQNIYVYEKDIEIEYTEKRKGITINGSIHIDENYLNDNKIIIVKQ